MNDGAKFYSVVAYNIVLHRMIQNDAFVIFFLELFLLFVSRESVTFQGHNHAKLNNNIKSTRKQKIVFKYPKSLHALFFISTS